MKILHFSAECYPYAKVGGLADVVGALPRFQNKEGHTSTVIMPYYKTAGVLSLNLVSVWSGAFRMGSKTYTTELLSPDVESTTFKVIFVRIAELLDREKIYMYVDDTERFLAFQLAVLAWLSRAEEKPDIIHCHDHHSGLVPFFIKHTPDYASLKKIAVVYTIHNAQYQGNFDWIKSDLLPDFTAENKGLLDWNHQINPLAAGIKCADLVTTVSQGYLNELKQSTANGLEQLFRMESDKCFGIINGIDRELWDPETDVMVPYPYGVKDHLKGKTANKIHLCKRFGLDPNKPLFAFIGRMVFEKGADLFSEVARILAVQHQDHLNLLVTGSGVPEIEDSLNILNTSENHFFKAHIGYDEGLAHEIYAGADFLLMPSRVEPCGLNQLYSLRYGTVPIVRRTGGLADTIKDIGDGGEGICFDQATATDIVYSIERALALYNNQTIFNKLIKSNMQIDHSWEKQCLMYTALYHKMIKSIKMQK